MDHPRSAGHPHTMVWLAVMLALVTHVFLIAGPYAGRTFDAEGHLFFASHYMRGWFDPWEARWYGGFSVFSYPPLVHQLIALLGRIAGLETAYTLVQVAAVSILPPSVFFAVRELLDETAGAYAAVAAAALSGTYLLLYAFGQLPNVAAVPLIMMAAGTFLRYLREGRRWDLVATAAFGCAAVLTTTTSQIILPTVLVTFVLQKVVQDGSVARPLPGRAVRAAVAILALTAVASAPFWWWLVFEAEPIAPIPHITRTNIFSDAVSAKVLFWHVYGAEVLVLPLLMLSGTLVRRPVIVVAGYTAFLAVLGLGGTTPVPRWLFGGLSQILVYERYAFWAAIILTIPIGLFFKTVHLSRPRRFLPLAAMFLAASLASSAWAAAFNLNQGWVPDQLEEWEESEIIHFLSTAGQGRWTYLVLGLGEAEAIRLTRKTSSATIDGFYAVARRPAELRQSEVGLLSAAKFFPKGIEFVEKILRDPGRWSLRWVVVADEYYTPLLVKTGWIPAFALGGHSAAKLNEPYLTSAWIWEAPAAATIPPYQANPVFTARSTPPALLPLVWGVAPLAVLALAAAAGMASLGRGRGGE